MNGPSGRSKGQEARSKKARSKKAEDLLSVRPHHFLLLASCFLLLASCFLLLTPTDHARYRPLLGSRRCHTRQPRRSLLERDPVQDRDVVQKRPGKAAFHERRRRATGSSRLCPRARGLRGHALHTGGTRPS